MNLKFTVQTISENGFQFKPTDLRMEIVNVPNDEENVRVSTTLTQNLENGSIIESRNRVLPKSLLVNVFNGFDPNTMLPTVDLTELNSILVDFGIEII